MTPSSIAAKPTIEEFVASSEQFQTEDIEVIAARLLQLAARRKVPHLSQRETELVQQISGSTATVDQTRYRFLVAETKQRTLTAEEQQELEELIRTSEERTARRLAMLIELSQLRRVTLPALMEQLQIKAPDSV